MIVARWEWRTFGKRFGAARSGSSARSRSSASYSVRAT
jgi:hypothetical protein